MDLKSEQSIVADTPYPFGIGIRQSKKGLSTYTLSSRAVAKILNFFDISSFVLIPPNLQIIEAYFID